MEPMGEKIACVTMGIAVLVDWSQISSCGFTQEVLEIAPAVGYSIASALTKLRIPLSNVELVGHSLGAHVMGYCGCSLNGQPKRITGKFTILRKIEAMN